MPHVGEIVALLEELAPPVLAEDWDNVGLLVGDRTRQVERLMTCLTVTPSSAAEAIDEQVDLIVSHHPLPFRPLKRLTTDTPTGRMLWDLIGARIAIYSPHTAFDSAGGGINRLLADGSGLLDVVPLVPKTDADGSGAIGTGRMGRLPTAMYLDEFARSVRRFLGIAHSQVVGDASRRVERVAIGCGSAGEFLEPARAAGCDCLLTGEARFHTCLEAEALEMGLILVGHYASERFGVERLAEVLAGRLPGVQVWASRKEADPLRLV